MNYGFWIYGELDRKRLAAALAEMLSLPEGSVDVGEDGDEDRRWEAPVSCTVTPLLGELHWHLDIYVSDVVPGPPPESAAGLWLAGRLRTVVAYQALPFPPSAFWLVAPDGTRTRARVYEQDSGDTPSYRIDAVERPFPALPGLRVAALPEVIREYRMPTPVTDRLRGAFEESIVHRLGAWEGLIRRLEEGWPPDGWYPAEYYRQDLEVRDELAAAAPGEIARAVGELDERFTAATEDDGGRALAAETGPVPDGWWWRRVPQPLPWRDAPGSVR